ncbi:NAD(P)-binding protein [Biscogniauxia marginata]|nr:NAD(P)-binding protein [Biscogniauxia marginata]
MAKVFIAGATGKQGSAAARALLKSGHEVHALVRDTESRSAQALKDQGAVLFKGNILDIESIKPAIAGTIAVFWPSIIFIPDLSDEVRANNNVVEAAKQSGTVQHLIFSTFAGIDKITQCPGWDRNAFYKLAVEQKLDGEEKVRRAGLKYYTLLRPAEFMSNYLLPSAKMQFPDLISTGVLHTSWTSIFKNKFIDEDDIGRTVAAAVADPERFNGKEVEIAADRLSVQEALDIIGAVAGKKLSLETQPYDEAMKVAEQNPVKQGEVIRVEVAKLREDYDTAALDDFGLGFTSFKDFIEKNKAVVIETYKNVP